MNNLMQVNYNEEIVITTKMLAEVYECDVIQIQQNFNNNTDRFIEGKHKYLGTYENINEAIEVRREAEEKHFGEFANPN